MGRRRNRLIAALAVAVAAIQLIALTRPAAAIGTLDVSNNDVPARTEFVLPPGTHVGQTFLAGASGQLVQVDVPVAVVGSPDPLVVNILATEGTAPTGPPLGSGTITAAQLGPPDNGPTWVSVALSPAVPVVPGGTYAIALVIPATHDEENHYVLYGSFEPGTYPNGSAYLSADGGATWMKVLNDDDTDQDLAFRTYVAPPPCTLITGSRPSGLTLNGGEWCVVDATVGGGLNVGPGTKVTILRSTFTGAIKATAPASLSLCESRTDGNLAVADATGPVIIGGAGCAASTIGGAVTLNRNAGGLTLQEARVGSHVMVTNNVTPAPGTNLVSGNRIRGSLVCTGNNPVPTNGGVPNSVTGARAGQCSTAGF